MVSELLRAGALILATQAACAAAGGNTGRAAPASPSAKQSCGRQPGAKAEKKDPAREFLEIETCPAQDRDGVKGKTQ